MNVRILGAHGSDSVLNGPNGPRMCRSVGFLVNDELMVDAGTLASELTLEEQKRVKHIFLSHFHLDHIRGIPPLADNVSEEGNHQVVVASVPSVLAGLQTHMFNNVLFPNFFIHEGARQAILRALPIEPNKEISASGGVSMTAIPVNHTVETVGFVIRDDTATWIYSGDTHVTEDIWTTAAHTPNLKGVFIEVSFPDSMMDLAIRSKHLTPTLLAQEFRKIGKPDLPVFICHIKPSVREQIIDEIQNLDIPHITILEEGMELNM